MVLAHRKPFGRDHQGDDHLAAIRAMIPAVAILGFGHPLRLTFHIGAGQIVEEHFVFGRKEILPAPFQVSE
jgi:hypothetical protein